MAEKLPKRMTREQVKKLKKEKMILEYKRISQSLGKENLTLNDFIMNCKLPQPHSYYYLFGNFGSFKQAAGIQKEDKSDFYLKKKFQLKEICKEIAKRNNNSLSYKIIAQETNRSVQAVMNDVSFYFNGLLEICKEIGCEYSSSNKSTITLYKNYNPSFKLEIKKDNFEIRMKEIAEENNNSLSYPIIYKNCLWAPAMVNIYISRWYGGIENMCKGLGVIFIRRSRINVNELDILKNIRGIYLKNGRKINQNVYRKKGKYKLELINDLFGSFGKACAEVNIQTEAMKNA